MEFPFPKFTKRQQKASQKAKVPTPSKRGGVYAPEERTVQTTVKLDKLPKVLRSSIIEKNLQIFEIPSPSSNTGFNEIAWRDQNGSKLYLENLDSEGTVLLDLKVTYPEVQSLAEKSGWPNSLPDAIYVKSGGGDDQRMAAKKMVLGLLKSYQSDKKPPKPIILKETQTDNVGPKGLAIEFSVKNITQLDPIMMQDDFGLEIMQGIRSAARFGPKKPSPNLGPINDALTSYQAKLQAGVENGFRVEGVDAAPEARAMFQEIKNAANDLKDTIDTTIERNPDSPLLTKLKTLQKQVESAIKDGFTNELDTRRWQQWLDPKLKPLTEDVIVPGTGTQIGAGVQGPVFKYELDPASERKPAVLKYDSNGLNNNATGAGIPELNPQQSVRAVAAFKMSEHLNLGVIPRTEVFVGTDADGRPKLGQAMEFVNGAIGQRAAGKKNENVDQKFVRDQENILKNPNSRPEDLRTAASIMPNYVKVNGKWYRADVFPVDIDYGDGFVQKGLSNLQVFDYIIGHADRNPGNWIYEKDNTGSITGVKGIDNDDTFGKRWSPEGVPLMGGALRGIPPIVDISTALSILNADFAAIRPLLAGLSDEEVNKAAERFAQVQQEVGQRVMSGKIASMENVDQATLDQLHNKVTFIGPRPQPMPGILRWGDQGIAGDHTDQNSYLGFQIATKDYLAQKYPGSEGVIPQSGDVLV